MSRWRLWKWWGQSLRAASATLVAALLMATQPAVGAVHILTPSKDNTLYESTTGSLSNGAGQHIFAGRTEVSAGALIRRGLIAFDVAGDIPPGSIIVSASLTLNMSRTVAGPRTVSLHRVLADWGEGTSDEFDGEGGGAASTPGDATWIHRFFSSGVVWFSSGGDFALAPSTSIVVNAVGFYTWGSTPGLVNDVQGWLNSPASNSGWILIGDESTFPTAKRFDSKDNLIPTLRPVLTVEFSVPGVPAGRIPDGEQVAGTPLTLQHAALGNITLNWAPSCLAGSDTDFEIYEGTVGDFTSHVPRFCSTGGAETSTFLPAAGSTFYLVVPNNATREGSYGTDSNNVERPQGGVFACWDQEIGCP